MTRLIREVPDLNLFVGGGPGEYDKYVFVDYNRSGYWQHRKYIYIGRYHRLGYLNRSITRLLQEYRSLRELQALPPPPPAAAPPQPPRPPHPPSNSEMEVVPQPQPPSLGGKRKSNRKKSLKNKRKTKKTERKTKLRKTFKNKQRKNKRKKTLKKQRKTKRT